MKLSDHFTLAELTVTEVRRFIPQDPPADVEANLHVLADRLEIVRAILGHKPIFVSSGYRNPALNKAVGGSKTSAHMMGWAADFVCPAFGPPLAVCRAIVAAGVAFDQLIEEGTWVHISFDPRLRGQVLSKDAGGRLRPGLPGPPPRPQGVAPSQIGAGFRR